LQHRQWSSLLSSFLRLVAFFERLANIDVNVGPENRICARRSQAAVARPISDPTVDGSVLRGERPPLPFKDMAGILAYNTYVRKRGVATTLLNAPQ
jgi:hypothetical protein